MERIKPNWELKDAISSARKTIKALEKYGKELEPRLPAGAVDGLKADLAVLTGSRVERPAFRKTSLAKTKGERSLAQDEADLLSRLRYSIRVCPSSTAELLKAVGVGRQVSGALLISRDCIVEDYMPIRIRRLDKLPIHCNMLIQKEMPAQIFGLQRDVMRTRKRNSASYADRSNIC